MIKELQFLLKNSENIDSALIVSPENRRYFTEFPSSDGFLLVTRDDAVFITDSRYIEAAENKVTEPLFRREKFHRSMISLSQTVPKRSALRRRV